MFKVLFAADVEEDLKEIPPFHRNRILDEIERQLAHQPLSPTKNRKLLVDLLPPWKAESKVWELRVGPYRIFYDVDQGKRLVYIRAVRRKPHGKTTEEIL
ncbi:MAG: type II toxin-antitoxin system RelE family toxin [Nitrospiraceae bacterium]